MSAEKTKIITYSIGIFAILGLSFLFEDKNINKKNHPEKNNVNEGDSQSQFFLPKKENSILEKEINNKRNVSPRGTYTAAEEEIKTRAGVISR